MSEELIIEQPQGGVWLAPGKRLGHLIAFFACTSKEMAYDDMSKKDKEKASFDFVDLDQERTRITGVDNHPGVTNKLRVGNPAVVLGRIGTIPSKAAGQQDAIILGEHTPADAQRLREWFAQTNGGTTSAPAAPQAVTPVASSAPAQVTVTPVAAPATPPAIDFSKMDPGTLELLQKAMAQQAAQ